MKNSTPQRRVFATGLSALLALAATAANAQTAAGTAAGTAFDTDQPLICAVGEVSECREAEACVNGPAALFNLPMLMRVNLADKTVESIRDNAERRVSPILDMAIQGDALMLRGVDGETAWVAAIRRSSGRMTVTTLKEGAAFVVFGTCAPL